MNGKQRIDAAVALQKPDRVPLAPLLDHFAATYTGITKQELIEDGDKRIAAVCKTATELGPWDMSFMAEMANLTLLMGGPAILKLPGRDLPVNDIHQYEEIELLTRDDYDLLGKLGLVRFLRNVGLRLYPDMGGLKGILTAASLLWVTRKHANILRKTGVDPAVGFILPGPLIEYFSIGRKMSNLCLDLFQCPDKITAVNMGWAKSMTNLAIKSAKFAGVKRIFIGMSRGSPMFISPKNFEKFVLPELEYMIDTIVEAGMTPLLHADTDWTKNFPYFKKFPAKSCILELDGTSNILKAKEILGDHMCIMGDVPAAMLAFGTKQEVLDYCKNLIKDVGEGGGFILSSGCSIPANAKTENVRAMYEAVEEWGYYQS